VTFVGPVCVGRGRPVLNANRCWEIPTIMKTGCLVADHPLLGPIQLQILPSRGKIIQSLAAKRQGKFFPAESFFDVSFCMVVGGVEYVPFNPLDPAFDPADPCGGPPGTVRMAAPISIVPPCGTPYVTNVAVTFELYDCWTKELFSITVMQHLQHEVVQCPPDIQLPQPSVEEHCSVIEIVGPAVVPPDPLTGAPGVGTVCLTLAIDRGPPSGPCDNVIVTTGPVPVVDGQSPQRTAFDLCRALRRAIKAAKCKCTVRCFGPFIEVCCRTHIHDLVCCLTGTDIPPPGLPLGSLGGGIGPGPVINLGQEFIKRHRLRRIPWRPHVSQETDALIVVEIPGLLPPTTVPMRGPSIVAVGGGQQATTVPIELVALSLTSLEPVQVGGPDSFFDIFLDLDPENRSAGVSNIGSSGKDGVSVVDSFFDVFYEISLRPAAGPRQGPGQIQLPKALLGQVRMRVEDPERLVPVPGLRRPIKYLAERDPATGQPIKQPLIDPDNPTQPFAILCDVQHCVTVAVDKATASPGDVIEVILRPAPDTGFDPDPDNNCVLVKCDDGRVIPLRARQLQAGAGGTLPVGDFRVRAQVGPVAPDCAAGGPIVILPGVGDSDPGDPPAACSGLLAGTASWSWGPTGNPFGPEGPHMTGNPADPPPGVTWYFAKQEDDKVCLRLPNEDWCPGARVSVTGRILSCPEPDPDMPGGNPAGGCKGYDFQHDGYQIDFGTAGGSVRECAELICCLIKEKCKSLTQAGHVPPPNTGEVCCDVEQDPVTGGVVIKLFIKDATGAVCPLIISFLAICIECPPPIVPCNCQLPGDCNQDGFVDLSDAVCLLQHIFANKPPTLPCDVMMDCNGDGAIDLSDAVWALQFQFNNGPPPVLGRECVCLPDCPPHPVRCTPPETCLPPPTPPDDTPLADPDDDFFSAMQLNPVDDAGDPILLGGGAGGPTLSFIKLLGPVVVERGPPFLNASGKWQIDTEMIQMDLSGISGLGTTVKLAPGANKGAIISQNGPGAASFYPCDSFFDISVEVVVPGLFNATIPSIVVEAENQVEVPGCDCYRTEANFHAENPDAGPNFTGGHLPCPPGCDPQKCSDDRNQEPCPVTP